MLPRIPDYTDVLKEAVNLRKENSAQSLSAAKTKLLEALRQFPTAALPLTDELVTVLLYQNQDTAAKGELDKLIGRFPDPGEETLCRFGKIYKRIAERYRQSNSVPQAINNLQISEEYYHKAFEKSKGFYPLINELTIRFLRAVLLKSSDEGEASQVLLGEIRAAAKKMLDDPQVWLERKADDHIWVPATRGEALLLRGEFDEAEIAYEEAKKQALKEPGQAKFYFDCMRDQIRNFLIPAYEQLDLAFTGPLATPESFFQLSRND